MGKSKYNGSEAMSLSGAEGASYLHMDHQVDSNAATVYVEGDTDSRVYEEMFAPDVKIVISKGKEAAMEAVALAKEKGNKGAMAIVDSDFDRLKKDFRLDKNVIRTDTHDLETLMLSAGVFKDNMYVDTERVSKSVYDRNSLWEKVMEIAMKIGKMRFISEERGLNLDFSYVEEQKLFDTVLVSDGKQIEFDEEKYMRQAWFANKEHCPLEGFSEVYDCYINDHREFDPWQICRGHDLTLLISIIYSESGEMMGRINVSKGEIERVISTAYTLELFRKTKMCDEIIGWQFKSKKYRILKKLKK